jgi:hypothetical protein
MYRGLDSVPRQQDEILKSIYIGRRNREETTLQKGEFQRGEKATSLFLSQCYPDGFP